MAQCLGFVAAPALPGVAQAVIGFVALLLGLNEEQQARAREAATRRRKVDTCLRSPPDPTGIIIVAKLLEDFERVCNEYDTAQAALEAAVEVAAPQLRGVMDRMDRERCRFFTALSREMFDNHRRGGSKAVNRLNVRKRVKVSHRTRRTPGAC